MFHKGDKAYHITDHPMTYTYPYVVIDVPHYDWDEKGIGAYEQGVWPKINQLVEILSDRFEVTCRGVEGLYGYLVRYINMQAPNSVVLEKYLDIKPFQGYMKDFVASKPNNYREGFGIND